MSCTERVTARVTPATYRALKLAAQTQGVKVAWLVRRAIEEKLAANGGD